MSLRAKNQSVCWECKCDIAAGAIVKPITVDNGVSTTTGRKKIGWVHFDCISSDDDRIPICKHYNKTGNCIYEDICSFRHPPNHVPTNVSKANLKSNSSCADVEDRSRRGTWQRRRVYNHGKAGALRRWLINVFGEEYLSSGSGILDVAGGKGEVSFELLNLNNIPCTVIDPRELDLDRFERKYSREFYHKNAILGKYNSKPLQKYQDVVEGCTINVYNIVLPMHIPAFFHMDDIDDRCKDCCYVISAPSDLITDRTAESSVSMKTDLESTSSNSMEDLVKRVNTLQVNKNRSKKINKKNVLSGNSTKLTPVFLENEEAFELSVARSRNTAWTIKGLVPIEDADSDEGEAMDGEEQHSSPKPVQSMKAVNTYNVKTYKPEHSSSDGSSRVIVENKDCHEVLDYDTARSIVQNCSIVIGMHPDQATEHMIEFALRNNKPFAILPCCIYSRQFPTRFNKSGKLVTTYGDFVEYLLEKYAPSGEDTDDGIQAVEMDFEGKNVLLYYTGLGNSASLYKNLEKCSPTGLDMSVVANDRAERDSFVKSKAPIPITILQDPKQPVYRVVRGVATKELWHRLSDGVVKNYLTVKNSMSQE